MHRWLMWILIAWMTLTAPACLGGDSSPAGAGFDTGDANTASDGGGYDSSTGTDTRPARDAVSPQDTASSHADTSQADDVGEPSYDNACDSGPLDEPIDGCSPDPLPSTGDPYEDCVRRINQLRWECQCLPPLERWHEGESCADQQAAYDAENNTSHGGFNAGICSPRGMAQNECPGWGSWPRVISGCLQMMWDEGPGQPFSEHGHYINMSNTSYTRVACGAGGGWFVQNFR